MSEVDIEFGVPDTDVRIYGVLREVEDAPLIVFIHGLGDSMNDHQHFNGSRVLNDAGFATLRFDLYGKETHSRNLMDCTVDDHVTDVNVVLSSLRSMEPHREIGVIGHSLGGLVIQRTNRALYDAAVLWDPVDASINDFRRWADAEFREDFDMWVIHWGSDILVSKEMERTWWHTEPDDHDLLCPTKVIGAGDGWLLESCRRYTAGQTSPTEMVVIEGADHCFTIGDTAHNLYDETISWFNEHLS